MSRMRVTAAQILADCPLVVGFGGWGVLGSELPATGEHGPSVGYRWIDQIADANKEIWVRITTEPSAGTLLMWPDSSFEYVGPGGTAYAQLYVEGQPVDTPQPVTMVVGVQVSFRALILTDGALRVLPVGQENTGKKPIVLLDGNLKERVGSEGVPIILDAGALRTLGQGESLVS